MLLELRVKALGIIEEINWSLGYGLNVITGETGAGKSLVIDAVEALLGSRVDEEAIRHGAEKAQIEGVFTLPKDESMPQLRELLAEKGLLGDEETLVINCELRRRGRSILRVNGQAVPKGLLHQIGRWLVDVHGQSEHLSLLDKKYHLDFLDAYADTLNLRRRFSAKSVELGKAEQELKALAEEKKDLARREEFWRFQLDEISRAKLREGEDQELEKERNILAATEQLKELAYGVWQSLAGEDASRLTASTLDRLNEAIQPMKKLVNFDPALKQPLSFLEETLCGL